MVIELREVRFGEKPYSHMISKLNELAAQVQFEVTSMTSDQNCTPISSLTN